MNDYNSNVARGQTMDASIDQGLRSFMLGVYQKLTIGIFLAGALAYVAGAVPAVRDVVLTSPVYYIVAFAPAALILISMFAMRNPSPTGSAILYWAIVATVGLGMGVYVAMAEMGISGQTRGGIEQNIQYITIAKAFFITATAFAALSLWGYTTKKDLSAIGSFAIMAIWVLFAVGVVYAILPMFGVGGGSSTVEWMISGGFGLLSAALVAWQTQELKEGYYQLAGNQRGMAVMTNWGALNFFIMFVNMFRFVLMLLASRD